MINHILLDAGHGQETPGKRSPVWEDGTQYFEWEGNRTIREGVAKLLACHGIQFTYVNHGNKDVSLVTRSGRVNSICDDDGADKCLLVSIHSDAFRDPRAEGFTAFHQPGTVGSMQMARYFANEFGKNFPDRAMRGDDGVRAKNLHMTRETKCKAVLLECFFMTNPYECKKILMTRSGQKLISKSIADAIIKIVNDGN